MGFVTVDEPEEITAIHSLTNNFMFNCSGHYFSFLCISSSNKFTTL